MSGTIGKRSGKFLLRQRGCGQEGGSGSMSGQENSGPVERRYKT